MGSAWHLDNMNGRLALTDRTQASPGALSETSPMLRASFDLSHKRTSFAADKTGEDDAGEVFTSVIAAPQKHHKWIILPQSRFRQIWVQVTLVVAFYIIWVTPVRVGFDMQAQGPWFWIEGIINIFFYVDLVLNFFTAYESRSRNEMVTDHKLIAKRYLKSWFWVDLLATFPSDYVIKGMQGTWGCSFQDNCPPNISSSTAVSVIVLLRTMRVFRIIWIFKNFNVLSVNTVIGKLIDEFLMVRWVFSILELMVVLMFLGHMCGCFFYMFSHPNWQTPVERQLVDAEELTTWVLDKAGGYNIIEMPTLMPGFNPNTTAVDSNMMAVDQESGDWYSCQELYFIFTCTQCKGMRLRCRAELGFAYRYISAMYWAYTTMTTVGYGDIYATTIAEKIWAMATMVIGGFFLSFCFGRIASIVGRLDADRAARAEQIESLTEFLKDHELPKNISRKVLDFFKTNVKSVRQYDRAAVLARMPFDLRSIILQHMYDTCIKSIPMLQHICDNDPAFMADFTIRLHPYHTSADTFVYHRGEHTADVYILVRGEVHVVDDDMQLKLLKIPEGSIFGEAGVLRHLQGEPKAKRLLNVRCETACDMLRLPVDDAVELCDMYPQLSKGLERLNRARKQQITAALAAAGRTGTPSATQTNGTAAAHSEQQPRSAGQPPAYATTGPPLSAGLPLASPAQPQQAHASDSGQDVAALRGVCQELQHEVMLLQQLQLQQKEALIQLPSRLAAQLAAEGIHKAPSLNTQGSFDATKPSLL